MDLIYTQNLPNTIMILKYPQNFKKEYKEDLSKINSDFKFWLSVENTNINYPVVQSKDNSYYLDKDFYKKILFLVHCLWIIEINLLMTKIS